MSPLPKFPDLRENTGNFARLANRAEFKGTAPKFPMHRTGNFIELRGNWPVAIRENREEKRRPVAGQERPPLQKGARIPLLKPGKAG